MKNKSIFCIGMAILLSTYLFCIPGQVIAAHGFDEYGYNENARLFVGTFDNWEAFIYGQPSLPPVEPSATDVLFITRNWNKSFDDAMFHDKPLKDGAWCSSLFHTNLSGAQLGWTSYEYFFYIYSSVPIPNSIPIVEMPGFYIIVQKSWLTDPFGNVMILSEHLTDLSQINKDILHNSMNIAKSFIHKKINVNAHNNSYSDKT
ncbi:MAG: hypothetical protein PHI90_06450 [Clostridia bacterium]|nr:hypothetical protein [Clostridia bacterium]